MTKDEEKRARKEQFKEQIREAMASRKVTPKDIMLATGLKYHIVNDAIHKGTVTRTDGIQQIADYLGMDVSWLPASTISPPVTAGAPKPKKAKVTKKMMDDGRYLVTTKGEKFERTEFMTEEEVEAMEGQAKKTEVPTMTDAVEPLAEINEPEIWIDGRKYTRKDVTQMLEDSVTDHRKIDELESDYEELSDLHERAEVELNELKASYSDSLERIGKLKEDIRTMTDKYIARDKEAIKWQVQANEYREQLAEIKAESSNVRDLQDMTIGDAVKHYRALKRILKDEVLQ